MLGSSPTATRAVPDTGAFAPPAPRGAPLHALPAGSLAQLAWSGAWLVATGVLVLFMLSLAWLAAAIGVLAKSPEAANGVMFMVAFLPYASSAFVPVSTMPGWLQAFARNQPVTQVVDVVRGELMGTSLQGQLGAAVLWSVAIATVSAALAGVLFAAYRRIWKDAH